jgi:hypothetical protein
MEEKRITYIATYRGVSGFSNGYYEGLERNVIIAGAEIPGLEVSMRSGESFGGQSFASEEQAKLAYESAENKRKNFAGMIDRMYVYLGADGAGPGFEYIKNIMAKEGRTDIRLVACDCDASKKQQFAEENYLPIIWADCGGRKTLRSIVEKELTTEVK